MATIGRILRAAAFIGEQLDWFAADHGVTRPEGDILITLRRVGEPYRVSYRSLVKLMMLTPDKINGRVEELEQRGLVRRVAGDDEHRYVELTERGVTLVDSIISEHFHNEERMLAPLTPEERETLDGLMRKLLIESLEPASHQRTG